MRTKRLGRASGRQHHHHGQPHGRTGRDPHQRRRCRGEGLVVVPSGRLVPRPRLRRDLRSLLGHHRAGWRSGHPPLPRLPDRTARRVVELPRGGVPADPRRPPHAEPVRGLALRDHPSHVHPRERPQAVHGGLPPRRTSHGDARVDRGRAVDLLPRGEGHRGRDRPDEADRAPHRQDADARCRRLPPQRRDAVRLPRQQPRFRSELPVDDVEDRRAPLRRQPRPGPSTRRPVHPPRRPRAELLDHRHAHGRILTRGSLRRDRGGIRGAVRPTPRRRERGRHPDAAHDRLDRPGRALRRGGQARRDPPAGLRPPRVQELRPARPDHQAHRGRRVRGDRQEPAARHRARSSRTSH